MTRQVGRRIQPLIGALLAVTLLCSSALVPPPAAGAASPVYIFTTSDVNIEVLFRHTLIPDFTKAFPRYQVRYTNLLHGLGAQVLVANAIASVKSKHARSVNYDVIETSPVGFGYPAGTSYKDYFTPLNSTNIPNAFRLDPAGERLGAGYAVAYRASAVVLAYNSRQVPRPPSTFKELIAWIHAHPGKFTYCRPDLGGSGDYFVAAALQSVMDPRLLLKPYNRRNEASWPRAWTTLKSIEPDLFQHGYHPPGNEPILNLLSRGTIWLGTVWSDQALDAQDKGLLPGYIHFIQIKPPFAGGPTFLSVPKLAQNPAGAKAFINFILSPAEQAKIAIAIEGFPAIAFKYLPAPVVRHFGAIGGGYSYWPGGQYDVDLVTGWLANVPSAS